jgi:hypothetical protein
MGPFEPDTALVARQLTRVMAATPGSGIGAATPAEATASASVSKRESTQVKRRAVRRPPAPGLHQGEAVTLEECLPALDDAAIRRDSWS